MLPIRNSVHAALKVIRTHINAIRTRMGESCFDTYAIAIARCVSVAALLVLISSSEAACVSLSQCYGLAIAIKPVSNRSKDNITDECSCCRGQWGSRGWSEEDVALNDEH